MASESGHSHPGVGEYVEVGVILAIVTAAEVALYFAPIVREVVIPALLILTIIKFFLVIFWFMHLRFDARLFRRLFYSGVILAGAVFAIVWVIFAFSAPLVQA